jgi:LCP family protein required for cell wall assembly
MPSRHAAALRRQPSRHRRTVRRHPVLRGMALTVLAGGLAVATILTTAVVELETALVSYDIEERLINRPSVRAPTAAVVDSRDPFAGRAVNLLVIGSDSRDGVNQELGGGNAGSMRSDTTLIVHISADRERGEVISIPRDTLVDIPTCHLSNGSTTAPTHTKFNTAFSLGATFGENIGDAASCTIQTVESVTGIRIDGFIVVDFAGFVDIIDALGHVNVCVDHDMSSTDAKLDIQAGCQDFDGTTALAYARARKGKGMPEGSDIGRIARQQRLVGAVLDRIAELNLLTSMPDLYRFAHAGARSLTTSQNLGTARDLAGFALTLQTMPIGDISFLTAPHVDAGDRANVLFAPEIQELWDAIAEDRPAPLPDASASADPSSGSPDPPAG